MSGPDSILPSHHAGATSERRSTIRDVARVAAVSQGTVSRVINGLSVGQELRQRVLSAIDQLQYQPSAIARSMRTLSTSSVGVVITDISNPVLAVILKGAEEILNPLGYTLIVGNTAHQPERERSLLETLLQRRVDGLLLAAESDQNRELHEYLARQVQVPVVLIDRAMPLPYDRVHVDHAHGVRQATEYLISLGHRRIALITADRSSFPGRNRIEGYEAAFRHAGLDIDPDLVHSRSLTAQYGFRETSFLLSSHSPPTAIICGGNQILEGTLAAVRNTGWTIPDRLSVIACDDTVLTRLSLPAITVVYRDLELLGRMAAELLVERMRGQSSAEPRSVVLPTSLVLRDSCARI